MYLPKLLNKRGHSISYKNAYAPSDESSLSTWKRIEFLATRSVPSEDSDKTAWKPTFVISSPLSPF